MSEYQYYEFRCMDRPLTAKEIEKLRAISSRAEISSVMFRNEYDYGDLKADATDMLARYFDVSLYLTNWRVRQFSIRFSTDSMNRQELEVYLDGELVTLVDKGKHLIWDVTLEVGEDDWNAPEGILASLAPIREELLAGDYRALYLAWLLAGDSYEDTDREPPVPAGLGSLTTAQSSFVDFFELDSDLVAVAAEASPPLCSSNPVKATDWISTVRESDKDALLLSVLDGPAGVASVRRLFQEWSRAHRPPSRPLLEGR